eukprot:scaffold55397_cov53-Phaeocystis_antarctica.AAC.1
MPLAISINKAKFNTTTSAPRINTLLSQVTHSHLRPARGCSFPSYRSLIAHRRRVNFPRTRLRGEDEL